MYFSVMTLQLLETGAVVRDDKDDRLLPHPTRRQNRLTARDKNSHRDHAVHRKTHWIRVKFHSESNSTKFRHVNSCIHPCSRITSLINKIYMATNAISDMLRQKESPTRSQKKSAKGSVALLKESLQNYST